MHWIVLGASRGLGAALADELLAQGHGVTAVSRTPGAEVAGGARREATGRYRYLPLDLADPASRGALEALRAGLPEGPLGVVLNAAHVEPDVDGDGRFDREAYDRICRLGTVSLGLALDVFGGDLQERGGRLVGISSLSAWVPPFLEPRIAYPASKAFLTMALRSLRIAWKGRAAVTTVMLGNIGDKRFPRAPQWLVPSYERTARIIAGRIGGRKAASLVMVPLPVCLLYRLLSLLPDRLFHWLFLRLRRLVAALAGSGRS